MRFPDHSVYCEKTLELGGRGYEVNRDIYEKK